MNGNIAYDDDNDLPGNGAAYSYNIGAGSVSTVQDTTETWNSVVTFGDDSTQNLTMILLQMQNGDTFVFTTTALDSSAIKSVEIVSQQGSNGAGVYTSTGIDNSTVVCFVRGSSIETSHGHVCIELLTIGDEIVTRDNGVQRVRWIGSTKVPAFGIFAPICVKAGTFSNRVDLWVSPNTA